MKPRGMYGMAAAAAWSVLLAGAIAGCSKDSSMKAPTAPGATSITLSPGDGATGVRLDAALVVTFGRQVDRDVVERDLHLISERAIADSMCPDSATMSHPDMEHCMADSAMMRHLDDWHATPGSFEWDPAGRVCTFRPVEPMTTSTRYMVHMGRDMMDMIGGGMMGGHGTGMMTDHMMLHFTTVDDGGHDGHH